MARIKVLAVMRREYLARVRSRWFILTTILAPVLLVGAMAIPVLLAVQQVERPVEVSVVDESGAVLEELLKTEPFTEGRLRYHPAPAGDAEFVLDALREQTLAEEIAGYLHIPGDVLEGGRVAYWGRDVGRTLVRASLEPALASAVRLLQTRALGLEPEQADRLTRPVRLETYRVTEGGVAREQGQTELTAHILGLAIYMVVLLYGAMMLRAAVSEKTSKMVEIILSSLRPWELMLGKILGVGAVGLTQVGIWLALIGIITVYAASAQVLADVEFLRQLPVGLDTLFLFIGLFLTGYFLYGGMYASAGAIASSEQEVQQLQLPVTLVAIVPILIIPIVLEAPGSTAGTVLSWFPFFTPVLFISRYVLGAAAAWEIPMVFALQILAILFVAWIGGRIYRVGLLMTGKRPTLPELIRWVRHG